MKFKDIVVFNLDRSIGHGVLYSKDTKITVPEGEVPVLEEFDDKKVIGHATNLRIVNYQIRADVELFAEIADKLKTVVPRMQGNANNENLVTDAKPLLLSCVEFPFDRRLKFNLKK